MAMYVNTFFEERLQRLLSLADLLENVFSSAGLDYRVIGGLAAYLLVEEALTDAGRLTPDIDIVVRREDLDRIAETAPRFGLQHSRIAGADMLVPIDNPSAGRAVHLFFIGDTIPAFGPGKVFKGIRVAPVEDVVRMKLTSFRLKDEMHLKDMDEAGLITPEFEASLSPLLRERLLQTRARN